MSYYDLSIYIMKYNGLIHNICLFSMFTVFTKRTNPWKFVSINGCPTSNKRLQYSSTRKLARRPANFERR